MGYYRHGGGSVTLKASVTEQEVLESLQKTMFVPDEFAKVANGGRSPASGDVFADKWYSWTDTALLRSTKSLAEFLGQFFETLYITDRVIEFDDANKIGQEDVLMGHLAPFLEDAEMVAEWTGEDSTHWAWSIRGGKLVTLNGTVTYE